MVPKAHPKDKKKVTPKIKFKGARCRGMWASREGEKLEMAPARPAEVTKGVGRGWAGGAASMQKECT